MEFFLTAFDSIRLSGVYRVEVERLFTLGDGRRGVAVRCDPVIFGQDIGHPHGIAVLWFFSRFQGDDVWEPQSFPFFVTTALPPTDIEPLKVGSLKEIVTLAWAELYRTEQDAIDHVFDPK